MKTNQQVEGVWKQCSDTKDGGKTCPFFPNSPCCKAECNIPKALAWFLCEGEPKDADMYSEPF